MAACVRVDDLLLRRWPLPHPDPEGDKYARGSALVVAGSREMPGAAMLAGEAALRAGAGRVRIATGATVASAVAAAVPEARVMALPETAGGGLMPVGAAKLDADAGEVDALLVGPGLLEENVGVEFVRAVLPGFGAKPVVLDALAMGAVAGAEPFDAPVLLTPHAGEMAKLLGVDKDRVVADPMAAANDAARRWNVVVALKGATTAIATPHGETWLHEGGDAGLGTAGSGDVLAGLIVGLAARGAPLAQAAVWGVALHGRAGVALAARIGSPGYLARELAAQVPALLRALAQSDLPSMRAT